MDTVLADLVHVDELHALVGGADPFQGTASVGVASCLFSVGQEIRHFIAVHHLRALGGRRRGQFGELIHHRLAVIHVGNRYRRSGEDAGCHNDQDGDLVAQGNPHEHGADRLIHPGPHRWPAFAEQVAIGQGCQQALRHHPEHQADHGHDDPLVQEVDEELGTEKGEDPGHTRGMGHPGGQHRRRSRPHIQAIQQPDDGRPDDAVDEHEDQDGFDDPQGPCEIPSAGQIARRQSHQHVEDRIIQSDVIIKESDGVGDIAHQDARNRAAQSAGQNGPRRIQIQGPAEGGRHTRTQDVDPDADGHENVEFEIEPMPSHLFTILSPIVQTLPAL